MLMEGTLAICVGYRGAAVDDLGESEKCKQKPV